MAPEPNVTLTTAQLAQRTGVSAGTLRMWETRHGFPEPSRLPGGHHRYGEDDVLAVTEVLRLRERGLSLSSAIAMARSAEQPRPASIFAGLRLLRPDLRPLVMSKRPLLELTHALEDEYCARAGAGLLVASFQHERFFRRAERRWRELARSAQLAVVLADFDSRRNPDRGPAEVPVGIEHPLSREWTLVINAPEARACLAGWERPQATPVPDSRRRFEVLWSFEPEIVTAAARVAGELIGRLAPDLAPRLPELVGQPVPASVPELRFAAGLAHRIVGNMATHVDGRTLGDQAGS
jgi:DICT domain-containing protein